MLPSNKQIATWLKDGKARGALELLIGLDMFLSPAGVGGNVLDDDYFPVFVMPGDDKEKVIVEAFKDPYCSHEATYKIPKNEEIIEFELRKCCTEDTGHVPSAVINNMLYPDRFGRRI